MLRTRYALTGVVLAALVLPAGCAGGSPPAAAAAVRTKATLALSTSKPITGEQFSASGKVSTRFKRPVQLRVKQGSAWKRVGKASTTKKGAYSFPKVSATQKSRYSVLVPAAKHGGKKYKSVTTPVRTASPVDQTAAVDVLPQVAQQGTTPAMSSAAKSSVVARFSPARKGRAVTISRLTGGSWTTVARTKQSADGTAYYFGSAADATAQFRATSAKRAGAPAVTSEAAQGDFQQKFEDEFNRTSLGSQWAYREGAASSRTKSTNSRDAVAMTGKTVQLSVKKDPAAPKKKLLNAQISTDGTSVPRFRYGVFSARIKFARARGQHGSFWLQSPSFGAYPGNARTSGAEIDVVEFFGDGYPQGGLANFLYYTDRSGEPVKYGDVWARAADLLPKKDSWWTSYHVFSVRWTPEAYTFYVDGKQLFTTTDALSGVPQYLILSQLTSDWELKDLDRSKLPSRTDVDWVKVWQK